MARAAPLAPPRLRLLLRAAAACLLLLLSSPSAARASPCPPPGFAPAQNFSLESFLGAWFVQAQAPNTYQPLNDLFCVRAEYRRSPANPTRLQVFNQARVGSVTGLLQNGGTMLLSAVVRSPDKGQLAVGPTFLPPFFYGPYTVVAVDPDYTWAVISGGAC